MVEVSATNSDRETLGTKVAIGRSTLVNSKAAEGTTSGPEGMTEASSLMVLAVAPGRRKLNGL